MASHPRTARPVRASSVFAITPADDIYAEWAQCTPCTWVAAGYDMLTGQPTVRDKAAAVTRRAGKK